MSGYAQTIFSSNSASHSTSDAAGVTPFASLALPGFGAAVMIVTLLQVFFLWPGTQGLFRDSDTGWHVRNGEMILKTAAMPSVDRFSYTKDGQEWFAWEWLSDVALGGAHRIAGLAGV